tara:strand:- start:122 stop:1696 length:1575 start_codon:yes stop_codon:yes gene_type:complete
MYRHLLFSILIFLFHKSHGQDLHDNLEIEIKKNVDWYAGILIEGHKMPLKNGYEAQLYGTSYYNQLQPLLLSTSGELVWSEEPFRFRVKKEKILFDKAYAPLEYKKAGKSLREAFLFASENYFPPSGKMPPELFFSVPQYNTWIELTYNQNQKDILEYARAIIDNGMPPGIIMIDDNWQEDYGKWNFHPGRFPDPKAMMKELKELGFKVMLWVCPFVSADSDIYRELKKKRVFMLDERDKPAMVRWWNGVSALLDLTNPESEKWFKGVLNNLITEFGVNGFKLDAGDGRFYNGLKSLKEVNPNTHTELFAKIGLSYPYNEYRATWKMGGQPLVQRLHDKSHDWEDLKKLIPHMLLEGIMGYPFSCPDMIGGGQFTSFLDDAPIDQELVVRSTQVHALMPMMQFSVAPWRILNGRHFNAVLDAVNLRNKFKETILTLARKASVNGEPIVRSMEYVFPHKGYVDITDQFMLGNNILVAPFLSKGEGSRKVILPEGKWKSESGKIYKGGKTITIDVPLTRLPYFIYQ